MTSRSLTRVLRPVDLLDISPVDAEAAGIRDGDLVRIASRYGSTVLPAHVNSAIKRGELFATFQTAETLLNAVTGPHRDAITATPEYKVTAVRIQKTVQLESPEVCK